MTQTLADGRRLILASSSVFRRKLLQQLQLPFTSVSPDADETPLPGESGDSLAGRLARLKARTVAAQQTNSLVIGSDQVAVLNGELIGKPGNHARAVEQLSRACGKTVMFYTGLCLIDSASGREQLIVEPFEAMFRELSDEQIERYLKREQPYDCAGSFRVEALGIALFERLHGDDPNSLIGLPLIRLVQMLEMENVAIL